MIDELAQWFSELFTTPAHIGYLLLGMSIAWAWQGGRAYVQNRKLTFNMKPLIILLCVGILAFITVSTHRNNECIQQFNEVLRVRSAIATENDQLSIDQRKIVFNWMHSLVFPPPHIAPLENTDPRRQQWAIQLTLDADDAFAKSLERQRINEEERAKHPLPNPTCGD